MKKLLVIGGVIIGLGIVAVLVLTFFLGSIVKTGVNNIAPKITQTKVTLAGATVSPLSGSGTLSGLVVGNPAGWSDNNICSLGSIHVSMQPFSVLGDHIVVNEITIEAPEFNYETKVISSNVGDLLKNIQASTGGGKDSAGAPAAKDGKPLKFEVKKFVLKNGKVRLGAAGAGMTLPMPDITLNDLGTAEGGITAGQLAFAVMKSVTGSIISATTQAVGDIGKTTGAAAADSVKKAGSAIKGLFGGKP